MIPCLASLSKKAACFILYQPEAQALGWAKPRMFYLLPARSASAGVGKTQNVLPFTSPKRERRGGQNPECFTFYQPKGRARGWPKPRMFSLLPARSASAGVGKTRRSRFGLVGNSFCIPA